MPLLSYSSPYSLADISMADIHLLDGMSIFKDLLSAEQMVLTRYSDLSLFCLAYLCC